MFNCCLNLFSISFDTNNLKENSMSAYSLFGSIITLIPLVLIISTVIMRGKKILEP